MKKIIATLLAAAMLLGCMGCASEETTKKKKKTKKTTEKTEETVVPTEDPTDDPGTEPTGDPKDPTGDPTDTTDPTDTDTTKTPSDTADTSDPNSAPDEPVQVPDPYTLPDGIVIHHDLEKLQLGRDVLYRAFGDLEENQDYGYETMKSVSARVDEVYTIEYGPLHDSLEEEFSAVSEEALKTYGDRLDRFLAAQQSGGELPDNTIYQVDTVVYRADSEYLSCILYYIDFDVENYEVYSKGYTFRTYNGAPIALHDVVPDIDLLYAYVMETMDVRSGNYETLVQSVLDETCAFALLYDGIYIAGFGKVPVIGNEDMFDLTYFGGVPDTYGLILDYKGTIHWDVDEDGSLDEISVSATIDYDTEEMEQLFVWVNDSMYTFDQNSIGSLSMYYGFAEEINNYLFRTRYGYFLAVTLESWYMCHTCIFKLSDNGVTLVNEGFFTLREAYDPDAIRVWDTARLTGLVSTREYCALNEYGDLAGNSIFKEVYNGPFKTNIDLPANETDLLTMEIGDPITIPAGTMVSTIYHVEGAGLVVMRVLDPDESKTIYVVMETDSDGMIAGYFAGDAFSVCTWGE